MTKQHTIQSHRRHALIAMATATLAVTAAGTLAVRMASGDEFPPRAEQFVPAPTAAAGTLSLRSRATVAGNEVRLKQVCRWTDADAAAFAPIGELVVEHLDPATATKTVSMTGLRDTLRDAGVNLATVNLSGATECVVARSSAPEPMAVARDDRTAAAAWAEATAAAEPAVRLASARTEAGAASDRAGGTGELVGKASVAAGAVIPVGGADAAGGECNPFHTLRDRLMADLSERTNVPVDRLQVAFDPKDVHLLNRAEPTFRFRVDGRRVHDLGRETFDVTISAGGGGTGGGGADGGTEQKVTITCDARAWETQLVVARSTAYHAVLQDADVTERRTLVDHLADDGPALTRAQVIGQQAARDLRPGTVLTARLVDPVPLAQRGQVVTVTLSQGAVKVTTVARAMESGSFGQAIRVQNDATKDLYTVTLTGPLTAEIGTPTAPAAGAAADARLASDRQ